MTRSYRSIALDRSRIAFTVARPFARPFARRLGVAVVLTLALAASGAPARAQGTLATQGYGYATGQFSTRARGTAGAIGEFDALSPLNPAAMAELGRSTLYLQYDPEFRSTKVAGSETSTSVFRFPIFSAILAMGDAGRATIGVSASSFLDRTWAISDSALQTIGTDTASYTQIQQSRGGMNDVRLAFAWRFNEKLRAGIAAHAILGGNQVLTTRQYSDSSKYVAANLGWELRYSGRAYSVGAEYQPTSRVTVAATYRLGGALAVSLKDSVELASARVPDRFSLGVRADVAKGTQLTVSSVFTKWSAMTPMLAPGSFALDSWDSALGLESTGPIMLGLPTVWRAGLASRGLPFAVRTIGVRETSFAGGVSFLVAQGRGILDFALQRALRSASSGVSESAWTASVGLMITP